MGGTLQDTLVKGQSRGEAFQDTLLKGPTFQKCPRFLYLFFDIKPSLSNLF